MRKEEEGFVQSDVEEEEGIVQSDVEGVDFFSFTFFSSSKRHKASVKLQHRSILWHKHTAPEK